MKTLQTSTYSILFFTMFLIVAASCQSPAKLVQKQKYDKALDRVIDQLRKGKSIDTELRYALEDAFSSSTARDMAYIESMKVNSRPDNWDLVYDRAERIEARQAKIQPYLPIHDDADRKANFEFVKTQIIKELAAQNATEKYYELAKAELDYGLQGDKLAARKAHDYLSRINRYHRSYKDQAELKSRARALGTTHVLFEVENQSFNYVPRRIEDRITDRLYRKLSDNNWLVFGQDKNKYDYDYKIEYNIAQFDVSPDNYRETYINEEKVIEEVYYKKDECGNFIRDKQGNKIQIVESAVVRATVIKVLQSKEARIAGDLIVRDLDRNRVLNDRPIIVEKVFVKESCTYTGDERALSGNLPNFGPPVSFPREEDLIIDAVEELEDVFYREIKRYDLI